jgi:predicted acylesterase/phospholipase RssA
MRMIRPLLAGLVLLLWSCSAVVAEAYPFALALSGGGARGFAHIGVLKALEEEGLFPDLIVGSSIGSIVGGLYCAGYSPDHLREIALETDWGRLFLDRPQRRNLVLAQKESSGKAILTLRFRGWNPEVPMAVTSGQKLYDLLFDLEQTAPFHAWNDFDDLPIPFRAVATDITYGRGVVFRKGSLAEAMRASSSLPLMYVPYPLRDSRLVDGGVTENIPTETSRHEGAHLVVAVDLASGVNPNDPIDQPWEIADRVTTILQLDRNLRSRQDADAIIAPNVGERSVTDFSNVESLINEGYRAAKEKIPEIKKALEEHGVEPKPRFCSNRSGLAISRRTLADYEATLPRDSGSPTRIIHAGITVFPDSVVRDLSPAEVSTLYREKGFGLARPIHLEQSSDGALFCKWDEGRIRKINVDGLQHIQPYAVRRDFLLKNGDVFEVKRARRGLAQILGSEHFDLVTIAPTATDSTTELTIRAVERPTPQVRFGAGFSSDRKGRGYVEFLHDHLGPYGGRATFFGKYGEMDEEARFTRRFDRVLRTSFTAEANAFWRREEFHGYDQQHNPVSFFFFERSGAEAWAGRAFRRWGELNGGVGYEHNRTGGVTIDPQSNHTWIGLRSHIDTHDRYPFPSRGIMLRSKYRYVFRSTGELEYNRLSAQLSVYHPLKQRLTIALRGNYGWNDYQLPLWGQFSFGGEHEMPGLHFGERFGNSKFTAQFEARYDLLSRLLADAYISALFTVGGVSVFSEPFPDPEDMRQSLGARFSLSTLFGPMSLTAAEMLKSSRETGNFHVYLNLGHEF